MILEAGFLYALIGRLGRDVTFVPVLRARAAATLRRPEARSASNPWLRKHPVNGRIRAERSTPPGALVGAGVEATGAKRHSAAWKV